MDQNQSGGYNNKKRAMTSDRDRPVSEVSQLLDIIKNLSAEFQVLKEENRNIREVLEKHGINVPVPSSSANNTGSKPEEAEPCSRTTCTTVATIPRKADDDVENGIHAPWNPLLITEIIDHVYSFLRNDPTTLRACRGVCELWYKAFETQRNIRRMISVGKANTLHLTTSFIDVYEFAELMENPFSTNSVVGVDVVLPVLSYAASTPFSRWIVEKGNNVLQLELACDKHKPLLTDTFRVGVLRYFDNVESLTVCQLLLKNIGLHVPEEQELPNLKHITICDLGRGSSVQLWKRLVNAAPNLVEITIKEHKESVDLPYAIDGSRKAAADLARECLQGPDGKAFESIELINVKVDFDILHIIGEADLSRLKRLKIIRAENDPARFLSRLEVGALGVIMTKVNDTLEELYMQRTGPAFIPRRNLTELQFPKMNRLTRCDCNLVSIKVLENFPALKVCGLGDSKLSDMIPADLGVFRRPNVVDVCSHANIDTDTIIHFPRLIACFPNLQSLTIRIAMPEVLALVFEQLSNDQLKLKKLTLEIYEIVLDEGGLIMHMPMMQHLWQLTLKLVVSNPEISNHSTLGAFHPLSFPSVRDGLCQAPALRSVKLISFEILQIHKDEMMDCFSKKLNRVHFESCRVMCGGSEFYSYDEDITFGPALQSSEMVPYNPQSY